MRFRLRYQSTDLEMPVGDFVIGRSSECSLSIDDPLVSRRHAVIHVSASGAVLEDLGSRNGIALNGERVAQPQRLKHGDRVTVGGKEMVLLEIGSKEADRRATGVMAVCPSCRLPVHPDDSACGNCGTRLGPDPLHATMELTRAPLVDVEETKKTSAFSLLAGIADKALALGRHEDAERILSSLLAETLAKAQQGKAPPADSARDAVRYAMRLAEVTGKPAWVDWVFQLHTAMGTLMAAETVDGLYDLVRKVRHPGGRAIRDYVEAMRNRSGAFGARERFTLQRLEGLERVVGA